MRENTTCWLVSSRKLLGFIQGGVGLDKNPWVGFWLKPSLTACQQPQQQRILNSGRQPIPLVVAKASHLTTGNCVFILLSDGSVKAPQPVGPGKTVMLENQRKNNVLT